MGKRKKFLRAGRKSRQETLAMYDLRLCGRVSSEAEISDVKKRDVEHV